MEPLATYQQRFGGVAQRFDLHGNYLSVDGRKFGSQFNRRFDLSALNSHFDHGRSRAPLFYGGFVLIGIALVGLAILAVGENLMTLASVIPIVIGTVGIAALAFRARPLKVFLFNYKSGNSAFEIIGAGPDADRVEEFVSSVAAQIRKANGEV